MVRIRKDGTHQGYTHPQPHHALTLPGVGTANRLPGPVPQNLVRWGGAERDRWRVTCQARYLICLTVRDLGRYKSRMEKQIVRRQGTAMWFPDRDADLLRAVAAAEERTLQQVMVRALRAYAAGSRDYLATLAESDSVPN